MLRYAGSCDGVGTPGADCMGKCKDRVPAGGVGPGGASVLSGAGTVGLRQGIKTETRFPAGGGGRHSRTSSLPWGI